MFERNRIDRPGDKDRAASAVEITLNDGSVISGKVHHANGRSVGEELNQATGFVDFEAFSGGRYFLTKSSIHIMKISPVPRADQLDRIQSAASNGPDALNPWAVLRLAQSATREEIKEAYHKQVRVYHPDRFANMDLPVEVVDYLNAMARRVNLAYAALQESPKSARPAPTHSAA
jgi:DnaJ domain